VICLLVNKLISKFVFVGWHANIVYLFTC